MAITKNLLISASNNADQTNYAVGSSITPGANRLVLAVVLNDKASAPDTPTFSGNGLTWVQVLTATNPNNNTRLTIFRAMGASPSAGTPSADFGANTQTGCMIHIIEFDGVDMSGTDGSGAVGQTATNTATSATSLTVQLNVFSSKHNATFAAFGHLTNEGKTPEGGYEELYDTGHNNPARNLETEWNSAYDLSPSASWSTAGNSVGGALEIIAANSETDARRFWLRSTVISTVGGTDYRGVTDADPTGASAQDTSTVSWGAGEASSTNYVDPGTARGNPASETIALVGYGWVINRTFTNRDVLTARTRIPAGVWNFSAWIIGSLVQTGNPSSITAVVYRVAEDNSKTELFRATSAGFNATTAGGAVTWSSSSQSEYILEAKKPDNGETIVVEYWLTSTGAAVTGTTLTFRMTAADAYVETPSPGLQTIQSSLLASPPRAKPVLLRRRS